MASPGGFYISVGTPGSDGRIQEFRMIPPPGGDQEGQVLLWNASTQQPEWRKPSDLVVGVSPTISYAPLATRSGKWLVTGSGKRLIARIPT